MVRGRGSVEKRWGKKGLESLGAAGGGEAECRKAGLVT